MQTHLKRSSILTFLILCAILFLAFNLLFNNLAQARSYKPWIGTTIGWVNVQMDTTARAPVATRYAPDRKVTIFAIVSGEAIQPGDSNWYRISYLDSFPLYIYSKLIIPLKNSLGKNSSTFPKYGKVIVVNLTQERLYAYQSGKQVFSTMVMTGRSALPTPIGTFHVFAKLNHTTFYSPWSKGSSYWYAPTHINYALEFYMGDTTCMIHGGILSMVPEQAAGIMIRYTGGSGVLTAVLPCLIVLLTGYTIGLLLA